MPTHEMIALGDSLTYGYPFGKPLSWVQRVSEELDIDILNQGTNGDTLAHLEKRLFMDVMDFSPQYCIVLGGTNDVHRGVPLDLMQQHLEKITQLLLREKILPILGLPPPIKEREFEALMIPYRRWLKRHARAHSLTVIDFYRPFLDKIKRMRPGYLEDGVHPSAKGYQCMAEAAIKPLQRLLNSNKK